MPSFGNSLVKLSAAVQAIKTRDEYLRKSNLEALLDSLEHFLVLLRADKGDGKTLGTETTSTTHAVEVRVSVSGQIVVDGQVDTLNIDTTAEDIGGNADALVELLELLVPADTTRMSVD